MDKKKMQYDVVVIGGGVSGVCAAIAAARRGVKSVIIERTEILGGVASSGLGILGFKDRAGNTVVSGIAQEFIDRLYELNGTLGHNYCPILNSLTPINAALMRTVMFEKCAEAGVQIIFNCEIYNVIKDKDKVVTVTAFSRGEWYEISGSVFIDATGDGDVAYLSGADYVLGNEKGELQPASLIFTMSNVEKDQLLDYIESHPEEAETPEGYEMDVDVSFYRNAKGYNFLGLAGPIRKAIENGDYVNIPRDRFSMITHPNSDTTTINNTRVINFNGTDLLARSKGIIEGYRQLEELIKFIPKYMPGYSKSKLSMVSPSLGVRETRRILGRKTVTRDDVAKGKIPNDTVALCGYNIDIHHGTDEGSDLMIVEHAYGIPFGCMLPNTIEGLLVTGRAISVDWVTFGSSRIMSTCMALGEAAGAAAAMSVKSGIAPSQLSVDDLRKDLARGGSIISLSGDKI